MTITLSPHTEALLREHAARNGQSTEAFADSIIAETLEADQRDLEESVEAIREALDGDPKDHVTLEEARAHFAAKRAARQSAV